jgi:hypothetical protein
MAEITAIIILSALLPIFTITAFIVGYNINASRKIFKRRKKSEPTEDEKTLEWLDNATVYTAVDE